MAALHAEAAVGVAETAKLLLDRGAHLEATNRNGFTPLHIAALFTNLPVAEALVAHKANLNARAKGRLHAAEPRRVEGQRAVGGTAAQGRSER